VLARLAIAGGEVVAADRVIDELWDGDPPRSATNTLQSYVSNLRRVLGDDRSVVVERMGDGYRIDPAGATLASTRFEQLVAVGTIEALEEALALWHGPALGELADEPWARGPAVRLEELRLAATEARFDLLLAAGRHAVIVGDVEAAATAHPLRERLTTQLVLALYRSGRQAEALRAYERARTHLGEELGLDPSPELTRLADQVLAHDPDLDLVTSTPVPPNSVGNVTQERQIPHRVRGQQEQAEVPVGVLPLPPAVEGRRALSRFVGREAELGGLEDVWEATRDGGRRLAVVAAEPGAGKTRLVQQLARQVHAEGGQVLWGRCTAESLAPYQPVVEAFRTAVDGMGVAGHAMVAARPALGRLLPDVVPEAADEARRSDLFALYEALADLISEASSAAPILFVVDDVQWADTATLGLLDHLLASERGGRFLVVATARRPAGRATPELDAFVAAQRRAGRLTEVALPGLDAPAVAALLDGRGVTVDDRSAEELRRRTGGNPFFLEALADHGDLGADDARDLPVSVRDVLDGRLAALDPQAAAVLTAAAVIGLRVDLALLGAVTGKGPDELLDVVDDAVAGGLLAEDEDLGWVTFPHALVRQALIARTTRNREAHLHQQVADALEAGGTASAGAVAEHLLAAGRLAPLARRAQAALDAACDAVAVLADHEARRWVDRACAALDAEPGLERGLRAGTLVLSARVDRHLGRREQGEAALAEAVDVARRAGDPVLLARAAQEQALLEAGVGLAYGEVDEGLIALLDEALAGLPPGHDVDRSALLAWSSIARDGTDPETQLAMAAEALDLAEAQTGHDQTRALALLARRIAVAGPDGLEERLRLGPEMDEAARGWTEMEVMSLVLDVTGLVEACRVTEAEAAIERLRTLVATHDRPGYRAYLLFLEATMALLRADLDRGSALSNEALEVGADAHGTNAVLMWSAQQVNLARERGTLPSLAPIAAERVAEFPRIQAWRAVLSASRAAAGDHAGAAEAYGPLFADGGWASRGDTSLWYVTTYLVAEAAAAGADVVACAALAEALAPLEDRMAITGMGSGALGPLGRVLGLVREVVGDLDGAVAALTTAVDRAAEAGFTPWEARARHDRARVLRRRGGPGDAEQAAVDEEAAQAVAAELGIHLALTPPDAPGSAP
jgi:DNA-binding SARP family transcriptional activator